MPKFSKSYSRDLLADNGLHMRVPRQLEPVIRFQYISGEDASSKRNRLLQISARVLSRVNNKDTILTGWERAGLWPYNPDIAYKSSAVVETIEQLPSKANNHKRKREV